MISIYRIVGLVNIAIATAGLISFGSVTSRNFRDLGLTLAAIAALVLSFWIGGIWSKRSSLGDNFFLALLPPVAIALCFILGAVIQWIS